MEVNVSALLNLSRWEKKHTVTSASIPRLSRTSIAALENRDGGCRRDVWLRHLVVFGDISDPQLIEFVCGTVEAACARLGALGALAFIAGDKPYAQIHGGLVQRRGRVDSAAFAL